jgi:hypothetical protein
MSLSTSTRPGPAALATGLFAFAAIGLSACTVLFELWGRSRALALGGAVVTFALLGTLAFAMYRDRARIGRPARWCIALAAVVGLACGGRAG